MQYPLVTLLAPCFNTGKYIHRLLDSVLMLTYPNIEMYVIDDGSTDNSKCITCVPATETFIVRKEDDSFEIPSREDSLIARVPQTFRLNDILAVHRKAIENGEHNHIDSCTLMSRYGHKMNTIIGPMENIKITTPTDLFIFRAMVQVHENQQIFGF